tara:strand:- start:108072 stop:108677 length:606 start_codon:yes stop_codon:yes gene_type:complete
MRLIFVFVIMTLLSACVSSPPANTANICTIFEDRRSWYRAAKKTENRWGTPVYVSMAIIEQESSFQGRAKPPRTKLLWVIPWRRPSSAYGYAQVLDETWTDYKESAGNWGASRSDFSDAMDFVGWYTNASTRQNRISRTDAYNLYLAYHEGNGGWARNSYSSKGWLMDVARNVQNTSNIYQTQYQSCEKELGRNWFMRLFF